MANGPLAGQRQSPRVGNSSVAGQGEIGADAIGSAASSVMDTAQDIVSDVGESAQDLVQNVGESQKQSASELLLTLSDAAGAAASQLKGSSPQLAGYLRDAEEGLGRFGRDFENKSVSELLSEATAFAKRDPTMLLAGSVVAGFLFTRFIKSSDDSSPVASTKGATSPDIASFGQNERTDPRQTGER